MAERKILIYLGLCWISGPYPVSENTQVTGYPVEIAYKMLLSKALKLDLNIMILIIATSIRSNSAHSTFRYESKRLGEKQGGGDFLSEDLKVFLPSGLESGRAGYTAR